MSTSETIIRTDEAGNKFKGIKCVNPKREKDGVVYTTKKKE